MDEYEEKFPANNTWCVDDLDGGLAVDLLNLQCVGQATQLMEDHNPAYDMTYLSFLAYTYIYIFKILSLVQPWRISWHIFICLLYTGDSFLSKIKNLPL